MPGAIDRTKFDLGFSRDVIRSVQLPTLEGPLALAAEKGAAAETVFHTALEQAVVSGSDLIAFEAGVEQDFREAIANSSLLAQFVADSVTPATQDPIGHFNAYFGALTNFGWIEQERSTAQYKIKEDGLQVHKAIVEVLTAAMGGLPGGALALAITTINSLASMDQDSPLITLFNRQSQKANVGSFQVTLVRPDKDSGLLAQAVAFALTAERAVTQILFFKLDHSKATLRRSQGTVSINTRTLKDLLPAMRAKLKEHSAAFIADIPLPPPGH